MITYIPTIAPDRFNLSPENRLLDFGHLLLRVLLIFALIFLGLGWTAEWVVSNMSVATEGQIQQLFHNECESSVLEKLSSLEKLSYPEKLLYLEELSASLSEFAGINRGPVKVHLVKKNEVNATIRPDGEMEVDQALLDQVKSENELAFVLAHELGHLKHRDNLKWLGRKSVFLVMSVLLGLDWDVTNWFSVMIILGTGQMTGLHYDRQQEYVADKEGLAIVVTHYKHGGHALDLFERLLGTEQPSEHGWLSDHPTLCERIAHLRQEAKNQGWKMEGEAIPLPNWQY